MKTRTSQRVILGAAFAISCLSANAGPYRELLPTRNSATDEERILAFYLGPVVFQIKNKLLIFPFPAGQHPFDPSICDKPNIDDVDRKVCAEDSKSVFLRVLLPLGQTKDSGERSFSGVTLGYRQKYIFDEGSVDQVTSEVNSWDGGRVRVPNLDTKYYAAVRILPNPQILKLPKNLRGGGVTYFLVAKDEQMPHMISCTGPADDNKLPAESPCFARTGFLTDEFPKDDSGKYPFTLQYSFSAAQIDEAPAIQAAVVNTVAAIPRSRISSSH